MFDLERIYGQRNNTTGLIEWFFAAREGDYGPFSSKASASQALEEFKKFSLENASDGGRNLNGASTLSLLPLESCLYQTRPRRCG